MLMIHFETIYDLIHFILPTYEGNAFVQAIIIIFFIHKNSAKRILFSMSAMITERNIIRNKFDHD